VDENMIPDMPEVAVGTDAIATALRAELW